MSNSLQDIGLNSNAWPFVEARKILEKINNTTPAKGYILLETGYGPSGLPHIGTFGEVARTTMVMHALKTLCNIPVKIVAFSDDMDGLRKVPDNIPNKEMVREYLNKPLTSIPDPFGEKGSFGYYMNDKLKSFLDEFGFEYEFVSSTDCYKNGKFDNYLLRVLEHYDEIMNVMLPTLREERQKTYSPILPISPKTRNVLQVPLLEYDSKTGDVVYEEKGERTKSNILKGGCKLQWKIDWGMRWAALDVDYEMHGKDLIPSAELSTKIANILGSKGPILFNYELFLDKDGQKISKSKGNGLSIEEWLTYAPKESLSLYMYQSPKRAKRLYFDVIPKQMDDYLSFAAKYQEQELDKKLENPIWHIHNGADINLSSLKGLSYSLLLNLASVCNPETPDLLYGYIFKYVPELENNIPNLLKEMVQSAVKYYNDFIKPKKSYMVPDERYKTILKNLAIKIENVDSNDPKDLQNIFYDLGREYEINDLKDFFQDLYKILLGQEEGPRMGSFIALFGKNNMVNLIKKIIN